MKLQSAAKQVVQQHADNARFGFRDSEGGGEVYGFIGMSAFHLRASAPPQALLKNGTSGMAARRGQVQEEDCRVAVRI